MEINITDKRLTNITNAILTKIIDMELQSRALEEVLVDKGIITFEELEEKYKLIQERDFNELRTEMWNLLDKFEGKS